MDPRERLIVALDVEHLHEAEELVEKLADSADIFKVGIAPFTAFGPGLLDVLGEKGKKVFLDLKVHDIPNTVLNAAYQAARKNVFMMNFHCLGGKAMMEAAVKGAEKAGEEGRRKPLLLGVTVLTSMDGEGLRETGIGASVEDTVLKFASMAKEAGLNGVVASAREAKKIKEKLGEGFVIVTPGIRPEWAAKGDQKRVLSPKEAIKEGADYIVVGRPIIKADDPAAAAEKIIEEMEG
ncbi:MAG: orotidine-5'-phosphate decarboxylase [Candidatus Omnitrophica bacterium]|nr:orotidine-5'-phosphate decarboxylase [Candidatus Omnitrophota bacterium]